MHFTWRNMQGLIHLQDVWKLDSSRHFTWLWNKSYFKTIVFESEKYYCLIRVSSKLIWQVLSPIFNSVYFSRNSKTCGFFKFLTILYTQINFSIMISRPRFIRVSRKIKYIWLIHDDPSLVINGAIMILLVLLKISYYMS